MDAVVAGLDPEGPDFVARVTALLDDLDAHIEREDLGIFPVAVVTSARGPPSRRPRRARPPALRPTRGRSGSRRPRGQEEDVVLLRHRRETLLQDGLPDGLAGELRDLDDELLAALRRLADARPSSTARVRAQRHDGAPASRRPLGEVGQVRTSIQQMRGQIDSQTNSKQMDMLRLQSLSNKRNEAFDVMSNFTKKVQESRSSIIDNMR